MSAIEIPIRKLEEKLESLRKEKLETCKQILKIERKAPSSIDEDGLIIYDESKLFQEDIEELERLRREKEKLWNQIEAMNSFISDIKRSEQMRVNCQKAFEIGKRIGIIESKYPGDLSALTPEERQEYDQLLNEFQELLKS